MSTNDKNLDPNTEHNTAMIAAHLPDYESDTLSVQSLHSHKDRPNDYSSTAAFHFWCRNGEQMPLLTVVAQMALVTPIVTTVLENTFGLLGLCSVHSCQHTLISGVSRDNQHMSRTSLPILAMRLVVNVYVRSMWR